MYFVQPGDAAPDPAALHRILQAGDAEAPRADGAESRYVVPAPGHAFAVVEQATELLQGAGLPVARVERGLRWTWPAGRPMPPPGPRWRSCCTIR